MKEKVENIIFMDFDGVINNTTCVGETFEEYKRFNINHPTIPNVSVENIGPMTELLCWCYINDVKVVVSSMWKRFSFGYVIYSLKRVFPEHIVDKVVVACTPDASSCGKKRSDEIDSYLSGYLMAVNFVIVDDNESIIDLSRHQSNFYHVDKKVGLTYNCVENIKKMLANNELFNKVLHPRETKNIENTHVSFKMENPGSLEEFLDILRYKLSKNHKHNNFKQIRFEIENQDSDFNTLIPIFSQYYKKDNTAVVKACGIKTVGSFWDGIIEDNEKLIHMNIDGLIDSLCRCALPCEDGAKVYINCNLDNVISDEMSLHKSLAQEIPKICIPYEVYTTENDVYVIIKVREDKDILK